MTVEVYQSVPSERPWVSVYLDGHYIQPLIELLARLAAPYSGFNRIQRGRRKRHPPEIAPATAPSRTIICPRRRRTLRSSSQGLTWPEVPWLSQKAAQATRPTPTTTNPAA